MCNYPAAKFWDKISERYFNKPVPNEEIYQKKLQETQKYLKKEYDILEIGCGTGETALKHCSYVESVIATDFSKEMIHRANKRLAKSDHHNIEFECLDFHDSLKKYHSKNAILAMNVIHLEKDRKKLLASINQSLAQEGVFISSTPCPSMFFVLLKPLFSIAAFFHKVPYFSLLSANKLKHEVTDAGFNILQIFETGKGSVFIVASKK